ncbi:hypothetical protein SAMN04488544_0407 [Microlunatus sagamiharensis]|uniref:DUF5666 domain-containing protein n=1 Tax=Microlunatus sagamiharensis TaxID=546874 RepID=A0A1H2LLI4_9ACTN|nr:DUF5666 domain-containing protein [Microlunatus sagamiharensis]SDU81508.1 hypothetical protein SAMN04488544_0407 [Microlunatus sagamiharensis]
MKKPVVILATALSTVALAGVVGIGVASADPTTSPSPGASASATPGATAKPDKAGKHAKGDLTRRALHGEVTLGGKKHKVVDFQRGTVSSVSATAISVESKDGYSATYVVDAKTKVRQAKEQAAIGDVKKGDKVRVVAVKDGSTVTATRIADRTK